jgi:hypothetical protein
MSAKKMLVVYMAGTNAVIGVATRRAAGAPTVADLVGAGLPVRSPTSEAGVAVPADNLAVKEVDYSDDAVRQPLLHGLDTSGAVVQITPTISSVTCTSTKITINLSPAVAADKMAIVIVDAGPNRAPLKFTAKTVAATTVDVTVTGVPPGTHDVFASVDGYVSKVDTGSF